MTVKVTMETCLKPPILLSKALVRVAAEAAVKRAVVEEIRAQAQRQLSHLKVTVTPVDDGPWLGDIGWPDISPQDGREVIWK